MQGAAVIIAVSGQCSAQAGDSMSAIVTKRPRRCARYLSMNAARRYGIFIFFAVLVHRLRASRRPLFCDGDNVVNMLVQFAPLGIVVIGQVFVILVGRPRSFGGFRHGDGRRDRNRL